MFVPISTRPAEEYISQLKQQTLNLEAAVHCPLNSGDIYSSIKELENILDRSDGFVALLKPSGDLGSQLKLALQRANAELKNARAEID